MIRLKENARKSGLAFRREIANAHFRNTLQSSSLFKVEPEVPERFQELLRELDKFERKSDSERD